MINWKPSPGWIVIEIMLDPIGHQPTNRGLVLAVAGAKQGPKVGDEVAFKEATIIDPVRRVMAVALANVVAWRAVSPEPVIIAARSRPGAVVVAGNGDTR